MATRDEMLRAGLDLDNAWRPERDNYLLPPRPCKTHELVRAQRVLAVAFRDLAVVAGAETRVAALKRKDPERHAHVIRLGRLHRRLKRLARLAIEAKLRGEPHDLTALNEATWEHQRELLLWQRRPPVNGRQWRTYGR